MSLQSEYTPDEWGLIVEGPILAGSVIITADPAFFGAVKESAAIAEALKEFSETLESQLIREIGNAIQSGHRIKSPDIPKNQEPEAMITHLIGECRRAAKIVSAKSPEESLPYRQYLLEIAKVTAESSKEGGFLGFGATRVSEQEKAAIQQLADALELAKPQNDDN